MKNFYRFKPSFLLRRFWRHCKCSYYEYLVYGEFFDPFLVCSYLLGSVGCIGLLYSVVFNDEFSILIHWCFYVFGILPIVLLGVVYRSFRLFLSSFVFYIMFFMSYIHLLAFVARLSFHFFGGF